MDVAKQLAYIRDILPKTLQTKTASTLLFPQIIVMVFDERWHFLTISGS